MQIIAPIITGLIFLYAYFQSSKSLKQNVHGQFQLRLNGVYKWLGIICCLIGSFFLNVTISHWNEEIAVIAPIVVSMFFAMGIPIWIWYLNYEIVFDKKRIKSTNWMGNKKTIEWIDIENIKFNPTSGYLKLYTKVGRIVVLQHSVGFVEFLRLMEKNTKFNFKELKIPIKT